MEEPRILSDRLNGLMGLISGTVFSVWFSYPPGWHGAVPGAVSKCGRTVSLHPAVIHQHLENR